MNGTGFWANEIPERANTRLYYRHHCWFLAPRLGLIEPYPAVLLPFGTGTIKATGNQIDTQITAIYGRNDRVVTLGFDQLRGNFYTLFPLNFFPTWQSRTSDCPSSHRVLKIGPITIDTQHKTSEEDVKSAKQWFRTRLTENDHGDDVLCVPQEVSLARPFPFRQSPRPPHRLQCQLP
jgi:hypothetical protein